MDGVFVIPDAFRQGAPLDYARRMSDPAARELAFYVVANRWSQRDATGARAWLAGTTEISADARRVLLRQLDEW